MIQPKPFMLKCPQCGWSKMIYPKSDVMDMSWGVKYITCPQCGTETIRIINENGISSIFKTLIDTFKK